MEIVNNLADECLCNHVLSELYDIDNINKSPSNTTSVLYSMGGGYMFRPLRGHLQAIR
jgi:hypothetical protein